MLTTFVDFSVSLFLWFVFFEMDFTHPVLAYFPFSLKVLLKKIMEKFVVYLTRPVLLPSLYKSDLIDYLISIRFLLQSNWIQLSCKDEGTIYNENKWQCLKYRENWRHFNTSFVPFYKILQKCFQFDQQCGYTLKLS